MKDIVGKNGIASNDARGKDDVRSSANDRRKDVTTAMTKSNLKTEQKAHNGDVPRPRLRPTYNRSFAACDRKSWAENLRILEDFQAMKGLLYYI